MWKGVIKWSLLCGLIVYIVMMFVWGRAEAARHICTGIEVQIDGDGRVGAVSEKSVLELLKQYPHPIEGRPLPTVNTFEIAEFLRKFNNFETVDCIITTKGNLKVKVVPMVPAIRVFEGDKSYYVNKDGKTMAALPSFHVDVPVMTGNFTKNFRPENVLPIIRFMEKDSLLSNVVGMINAVDRENIILVPRIKGHVINFGDTSRLEEKRNALLTAYRDILPYKGWETYDTISVKFKGQIVATRRDKTPLYPIEVTEEEDDGEEAALQAHQESQQAAGAPGTQVPSNPQTQTQQENI